MKKVITAIGNPYLNERLKEIDGYEVIGKDIPYQEGILEVITEKQNIDIVILSNELPEEYDFYILVSKIKNIKKDIELIVFLKEKNKDVENFLNSKNIYKVYASSEYDNFLYSLKSKNIDLSQEIEEFKQMIVDSNFNKNKYFDNAKTTGKIIALSGNSGSGKTIVACMLANYIASKNKKTILLDFESFNSSINMILGINDKKIQHYNENLDVMHFVEDEINLRELIIYLKEKYDFILIDIASNEKSQYNKIIFEFMNNMVFLVEPNILELEKAKSLLEIYIKDFFINEEYIKIVFNKVNKYKISSKILLDIFSDFEIIGEIPYDERYTLIINKNLNKEFDRDKYKEIFEKLK